MSHNLKSLREALCEQQTQANWPSDIGSAVEVLIHMIDRHETECERCREVVRSPEHHRCVVIYPPDCCMEETL